MNTFICLIQLLGLSLERYQKVSRHEEEQIEHTLTSFVACCHFSAQSLNVDVCNKVALLSSSIRQPDVNCMEICEDFLFNSFKSRVRGSM